MPSQNTTSINDLLGYSRLGLDSITGIVNLVESMHGTIARRVSPVPTGDDEHTAGISGLVYRTIRAVPEMAASGIDSIAPLLDAAPNNSTASRGREAVVAALNGVLGDHLEQSGNPLAIAMAFRIDGQALPLDRPLLATAVTAPSRKILLQIHGLSMSDLQWTRDGHSPSAAMATELGFTAVHLNYNSGRHISHNGRELSAGIEQLLANWPVPVDELVILAHSMGGLLARSALHYAGASKHTWPQQLQKVVYLGTPHHGAPLERGGNWLDALIGFSPYTAPFARLSQIRSAGITDLRYGNLVDEDWAGSDRFARSGDQRRPMPLPGGIEHFAAAATRGEGNSGLAHHLVGDGLVPVASALGEHANPEHHLAIPAHHSVVLPGIRHIELLGHPQVFEQVRRWLNPVPGD